jgi:hypothetical protein
MIPVTEWREKKNQRISRETGKAKDGKHLNCCPCLGGKVNGRIC